MGELVAIAGVAVFAHALAAGRLASVKFGASDLTFWVVAPARTRADTIAPRRRRQTAADAACEAPALAARADSIVAATNDLFRRAEARGVQVVVVRTEHERDRSTWTLSMLEDDQGFNFVGSEQGRLLPGLVMPPGAIEVVKTRDSAFFGTGLADRLRGLGVRRLVVCGVEAQNCVALTGRDAFAHDFEVAFAVDAIASGDPGRGRRPLEDNRVEVRQPLLGNDALRGWW